MAFGQMKRTDFTGPTFQNNVMIFMGSAGGKFPAGTTFRTTPFSAWRSTMLI